MIKKKKPPPNPYHLEKRQQTNTQIKVAKNQVSVFNDSIFLINIIRKGFTTFHTTSLYPPPWKKDTNKLMAEYVLSSIAII